MKKWIALLLVFALALTLTACGNKAPADEAEEQSAEETTGTVTGGWTVNAEFGEAAIPDEAQEAFDKAMEGLVGATHTPVAYLGSQVVAGVNYAFLCKTTTVTAEPVTKLNIVTVYRDLEGKSEVLNIKEVNVADCVSSEKEVNFDPADMAGGWTVTEACGAGLDDKAQTAFDKAMEGFTGVGYKPLACLGTQVVAGTNYAILCSATSVTAQPVTALAVVTVYADLSDGAEILSIKGFNFTE